MPSLGGDRGFLPSIFVRLRKIVVNTMAYDFSSYGFSTSFSTSHAGFFAHETAALWPLRYLTGHAGKGAHAGYGRQWIETLKAAIEIIPNPLLTPVRAVKNGASAGS